LSRVAGGGGDDVEDDNTPWLCHSPEMPAASRSNIHPQQPPPPQPTQRQQPACTHTSDLPASARAHSSDALPELLSPLKKPPPQLPARGSPPLAPVGVVATTSSAPLPTPTRPAAVPVHPAQPARQRMAVTPLDSTRGGEPSPSPSPPAAAPGKKRQRDAEAAGHLIPLAQQSRGQQPAAKRRLAAATATVGGVRALLLELLRAPSEPAAAQCAATLAQWAAVPGGWHEVAEGLAAMMAGHAAREQQQQQQQEEQGEGGDTSEESEQVGATHRTLSPPPFYWKPKPKGGLGSLRESRCRRPGRLDREVSVGCVRPSSRGLCGGDAL
jgi:hypothetical protein